MCNISYGAWVDVNAERDGLLHVKDMGETFTPTARDVVATKDIILARVKFVDAITGKLGLSLVEVRVFCTCVCARTRSTALTPVQSTLHNRVTAHQRNKTAPSMKYRIHVSPELVRVAVVSRLS